MKSTLTLWSFLILFGYWAAGEGLTLLFGLSFPGSVIGMVLLVGSLRIGLVDVSRVEKGANFLLSYLGLLFVPPAVAIMLYLDLIARDWLALLLGTFGSFVAVLWATAFTARLLSKGESKTDD